ncbi:MAG: PucC family protein, partial [Rubrivivax sp.]|nr:PucC family protein [Rubrivivax sp.]
GVSAAGTSLLVLLAKRVQAERRAAAATVVWVMMIVGFAVTAAVAGRWLDPYSPQRLVAVSGAVSLLALAVTALALRGLEGRAQPSPRATPPEGAGADFRAVLREVWREPNARRFTVFVFVSMLAYSMQDLILEPFAGALFAFTPGASTQLAGIQHGGALAGMLLAALAGRRLGTVSFGSLCAWTVGGCLASALALFGLVLAGAWSPNWPLRANVFVLGLSNGAFSIAAIGSMMALASAGQHGREGTRMGLWGAAQAIGFALGGLAGAAASDVARWLVAAPGPAYAAVFLLESLMFVAAAMLAARIAAPRQAPAPPSGSPGEGRSGQLVELSIGGTP